MRLIVSSMFLFDIIHPCFILMHLFLKFVKRPKKVTLAPMVGMLTGPWLKRKITLNLHLATLKKRLLFLFWLLSEKNGLLLVFV